MIRRLLLRRLLRQRRRHCHRQAPLPGRLRAVLRGWGCDAVLRPAALLPQALQRCDPAHTQAYRLQFWFGT